MPQKKHVFIILLGLILGSLSWGTTLAQETEIELPQLYTGADNLAFRYPENWTLTDINATNESTEDDNFVSITDGKVTIEFYTLTLSNSVLQLTNRDLPTSIPLFMNVIGVIVTPTTPPTPLLTTIALGDNEAVIGTFILEAGQGQYILLAQGLFMEETEYIFIRVSGTAIDLLTNTDVFLAIIESFGTLATPDGATNTTANTTNPPAVAVVPVVPTVPCTLQGMQITNADGTSQPTALRVGPGTNRGVIGSLPLDRDFTVIGKNTVNNTVWWQLDKSEAAPRSGANQTWVVDSQVTTSGDCDLVVDASAPPIIRAPQVPSTTTDTGSNEPPVVQPEAPAGSSVEFSSRSADANCTELIWNVSNVRSVRLQGDNVSLSGTRIVCPSATTTYTLFVTFNSGTTQEYQIRVEVEDLVFCLINQDIPFERYGLTHSGSDQFFTLNIDPCRTPMRIFIEMYSTDLDSLIDVRVDGSYVGSDDDSGGGLNAYLEVFLPAGTTSVTITAKSFNGTAGTFDIIVDTLP